MEHNRKQKAHFSSCELQSKHLARVYVCVCTLSHFSCVSVMVWTVVCQGPLSMGFSRQEYWSGLPCSPSGDPPNPGTEPTSLIKSPALGGGFFTNSTTWGVFWDCVCMLNPSSRVWLCVTLWTVALQAPLSKGLSRQEYWSGLPFPSPEDLAPNVMLTILFSPK